MAAANYNFSIEKGSSFVISFQYRDNNDIPLNLTNWCARIKWIDNAGNTVKYYTNTINENYSFTLDESNGLITLKIPAVKTAGITWTSANYDLDLQEPAYLYSSALEDNRKIFRILTGTITIIDSSVPYEPFACDNEDTECRTC
jgi:hypothetical protein